AITAGYVRRFGGGFVEAAQIIKALRIKEKKMVKKGLLVLALAALVAGGAFAQDDEGGAFKLSAGVGGFFGSDFGGGAEASATMPVVGKIDMTMETPYLGGGGFVFFDATYAELSLAFFGGTMKNKSDGTETDSSIMNFNIGLLGKYPIAVGEKLKVFPLLGIEYDICLSAKDEDGNEYEGMGGDGDGGPGDFSALWFKLGGGLDFALTEKLYLRFEALYGLRLENKFEKDMKDYLEPMDSDAKTRLGHGLTAKLALGFTF
ncbi:MAG: outer membrane beta-barrel protein, partial [Spirochaetaceae bacterium]|nr:outer membrane beta-barrel protein [Spirochaetaceae bacterium]